MNSAARQAAYRKRFGQGGYVASVTLTPDLQALLIDEGHLDESALDVENWRERQHELNTALARFLYARLGSVTHNTTTKSGAVD